MIETLSHIAASRFVAMLGCTAAEEATESISEKERRGVRQAMKNNLGP